MFQFVAICRRGLFDRLTRGCERFFGRVQSLSLPAVQGRLAHSVLAQGTWRAGAGRPPGAWLRATPSMGVAAMDTGGAWAQLPSKPERAVAAMFSASVTV